MKEYPAVSVIVPLLNAERQLPELMEALERQEYPSALTEIILVDNGSDDNTFEAASRYPATVLKEAGNKSPYAARNRGISASRGEVIALLDANKIPESGWLREGVGTLLTEASDLAGGAIHFRIDNRSAAGELADAAMFNNNRLLVSRDGGSAAGNLFFRREVWDKTGPFPDRFRSGMDIWWTRRAVASGFRLVYAPGAVVWCKPRKGAAVIGKGYRVGLVHPYNMHAAGKGLAVILSRTVRTLLPPRPAWVKERAEELGAALTPAKLAAVWWTVWMMRIAMAAGRAKGLINLVAGGEESRPAGLKRGETR